jgi:hypothetical protein
MVPQSNRHVVTPFSAGCIFIPKESFFTSIFNNRTNGAVISFEGASTDCMFSPNPLFLLHTFSVFLSPIFSIIFSNDLCCNHLKQKHLTYHPIQTLKLISLMLAMLCFPSCMNSEFIIFLSARFGRNRTKSLRTDDRKSDRIRMMDSDRSHVIPPFMMGRHNLELLL